MTRQDFDPLTFQWTVGTDFNWWDSTLMLMNGQRPSWAFPVDQAEAWFERNQAQALAILRLVHSYRTVTTMQLHALNPLLPSQPKARVCLMLASLGLIDIGFPPSFDGKARTSPTTADTMAVRLPIHADIQPLLKHLGVSRFQLALIGPAPLRGARQYTRHNLITTQVAIWFRQHGWDTYGEAWCKLRLILDNEALGNGGPDLIAVRPSDGHLIAVELTASHNQKIGEKISHWADLVNDDLSVVWLIASTTGSKHAVLNELGKTSGWHQYVADISQWVSDFGQLENGQDIATVEGTGVRRVGLEGWEARWLKEITGGFGLDSTGWKV